MKPPALSERDMEDIIAVHAEELLRETGLRLLQRQLSIGSYRFDLLFEDRHGSHLIVEIQKGTLDREHTYRILDYYREYKEHKPLEFVVLMLVANEIPQERKRRLRDAGVAFHEIPLSDFLRLKGETPSVVEAAPGRAPTPPGKLGPPGQHSRFATMSASVYAPCSSTRRTCSGTACE